MNVKLSERKIFFWIIIIIIILTILSITGQYSKYFLDHGRLFGFINTFDLGSEANIPTFFQTFMIFFSSFLIFLIIKSKIQKVDRIKHFWVTLFLLTMYLGFDEASQIHENWSIIIDKLFKHQLNVIFIFSWVIIGSVLAVAFIAYFIFFIFNIDKKYRYLFILSGILYIFGSIIMEMIDGYVYFKTGVNFFYQTLSTFEEILEMFGIAILVRVLLKYIKLELNSSELNINIKIS